MYLLKKVFELREKAHPDHEKPFLDHLEDLRVMITRVVITLVVSMIGCFAFQGQLMDILRAPATEVIKTKQQETMPDAGAHKGIIVPTVEQWEEAKQLEHSALGLGEEHREKFFKTIGKPEMEFHARSVTLLRAAKALPEDDRQGFVKSLGEDDAMTRQVLALLDSDPDVEPGTGAEQRMLSALRPTETFMLSMKLAFFAGIVVAFPLLLMFILQFVLPGLHENERKVLWPAMGIGFGLFLGGILFAYFFVLPRALLFFYEWSGDLGVSNEWRIGEYITFATQFTLLFGLSFELPVVVMVLVKLGLLTYDTMARTRAYAIVAIFIAAAVITPTPDIMTLMLMALPMLALYEICIWLAWFDRKKELKKEADEEEELRKRTEEWMLGNDAHGKQEDAEGEVPEPGDDCWHDDYHHDHDHHWHDEYHSTHEGLPGDEEWTEPEGAVTGDGGADTADSQDDIPEEERKRMNDGKQDE